MARSFASSGGSRCAPDRIGEILEQRENEWPTVEIVDVDLARRAGDLVTHLHQRRKAGRPQGGPCMELTADPPVNRLEGEAKRVIGIAAGNRFAKRKHGFRIDARQRLECTGDAGEEGELVL